MAIYIPRSGGTGGGSGPISGNNYVDLFSNQIVSGMKTWNDPAYFMSDVSFSSDIIIDGNIFLDGYIDTLKVEDNFITINHGETGSGVAEMSAGFIIDRASDLPARLVFSENGIGNSDNRWYIDNGDGFLQPILYNLYPDPITLNGPVEINNDLVVNYDIILQNISNSGFLVTDSNGALIDSGFSANSFATSSDLNNIYTLVDNLSAAISAISPTSITIDSSGNTIIVSQTGTDFNLEVSDYISKTEVSNISSALDNKIDIIADSLSAQISGIDINIGSFVSSVNGLSGDITIVGGQNVSVTDDGVDTITVNVSGITYTNSDPSVIAVGGIGAGTTFNNTTFAEFVDLLLYPELFGTLTPATTSTAATRTFTSTITGFREIGEVIGTITFTSTFNRGSISPQYQSASPFRIGLPNSYLYTGSGLPASVSSTSTSNTQSVTSYTVISGNQSWTGRVSYDAGVQPKGSKGTDFNSPYPSGTTASITRTITGVYPFFATTSDITVMTKQPLQAHGTNAVTTLVIESGSDKQSVEFPEVWGAITIIEQWNEFTNTWNAIDINTFTLTNITKTINSNTIDYRKYTHNGSSIGSRQLRWRVS